jgi:hypothetical protein
VKTAGYILVGFIAFTCVFALMHIFRDALAVGAKWTGYTVVFGGVIGTLGFTCYWAGVTICEIITGIRRKWWR